MKKVFVALLSLTLVVGLAGCDSSGVSPSASPTDSAPAIDPSLIPPAATSDLPTADPANFLTSYGDYIFRIGTGPTWCSINKQAEFVICEQDEAATQYDAIPIPDSCSYSYGFQIKLDATKPASGKAADFTCAGGYFADPTNAKTLEDGHAIKVGSFTCYTAGQVARCDNQVGNYLALGARVWALGN